MTPYLRRPLVVVPEIVVHRCAGCERESAAYEGETPRGWRKGPRGSLWCGRAKGGVRCVPGARAVSR
jgi:hypothetical protein